MSQSDEELLGLFQQKNKKEYAFGLLVKKYQQRLYWHIRRMLIDHDDTDDVLQNTFIKAWKGLDKFRSDSKLYTWLYRIATNETITFLNQKKSRGTTSFDDLSYGIGEESIEGPYYSGDEIQQKLYRAIDTLPEKQKLVFNMKYFDEMKYEDMSSVLNTSVGALKASYHHAVKKIEEFINNQM